jgi:surface antigen
MPALGLALFGLTGCVIYNHPVPYYVETPASSTTAAAAPAGQTCREYRTTATIEGKAQEIHGTACLQPDGTWQYIR